MPPAPLPSSTSAIRRLFAHAGDGRRMILGGYALILVDALAQVASPEVFRLVLNRLQDDTQAFLDDGWRYPAVLALGLAGTFMVSAYFSHTWVRRGAARWSDNLRRTLYEHVQRLSIDFFQRNHVGDVAARINQDVERLEATVWQGLTVLWAVAMVVFGVGLITWVDPWMGLLSVALLAVAAGWTTWMLPRLRRDSRYVREHLGTTAGTLAELVGVNPMLKAFNAEDAALDEVRRTSDRVRAGTESLARRQHRYADPLGLHLAFLAPFVLLFVGGWRAADGAMMIGDVVAVWAFWTRASGGLSTIMSNVPELLAGVTAGERAAQLLEEQPVVRDAPGARPLAVRRGEIRFEGVSFAYPSRPSRQVLDGFDLTVAAGERVALVGSSGAGKSTVTQLLLRFYDPLNGRVLIDGQDLRDVPQQSVRAAVGVVFQDPVLLSGSLARNLRLARPTATDDELVDALEAAHAWEFVRSWDAGLETELGERGVTLSGGQRQRLAIARVMLKDPRIVVLDEATSALDATSERIVLEALDELLQGRTSLVVAHRIATIRDADRIVVVEKGRAADVGTHTALLRSSSTYRAFCHEQAIAS